MTNHNEHIDALIARYFSGSITTLEEIELQEWRDADAANEDFFRDMEFVFFASASIREPKIFDTDKAWNKIAPASAKRTGGNFHIGTWKNLSIAASLILIALVAYLFVFRKDAVPVKEYAAAEVPVEFTLPDSSRVILEPGARLLALSEKPGSREYAIEGKGKFSVEHNESNPFILHSGEVQIKDLGTEFLVDARPGNDTVFVAVYEGKVQFSTATQKGVELMPDQEAYYLRSDQSFHTEKEESRNEFGSFDFQGQTLDIVSAQLSLHFQKEIVLENPSLANCRINVNFQNESLPDILEILALTLQLQINENDNVITLKGNGCK
ncbi:MAG TPA: hypothetical protein DIW47_01200 [Bacteroidetes bacterium]|nr:hypothetical protein [Bacteroidota bacterium]